MNVLIALGSNYCHEHNLAIARCRLAHIIDSISFSEALWTEPIGMDGDRFLNQICSGFTHMSFCELQSQLKDIEASCGRSVQNCRMNTIPLDLDILLYDNKRYHEKDWSRPYIRQLISLMG